jgi:hypothetical protein
MSRVGERATVSEYTRIVLDPTPRSKIYRVTNSAGTPLEKLMSISYTPRPKGALRWAEEENRNAWAHRVLASIPAPAHITAAELHARQPRESDRKGMPLP